MKEGDLYFRSNGLTPLAYRNQERESKKKKKYQMNMILKRKQRKKL